MWVDLRLAKDGFARLFPPGHPARRVLDAQPDEVPEEEYRLLFPILVRLAGERAEVP